MIVFGGSLGGMKALRSTVRRLPRGFPARLAAVLHRHYEADSVLLEVLQPGLSLPVSEPTDKEPIRPGHLYIAPADYHLLVEPTHFSLSVDEPVQFARPSIDVLFESAADAFGPGAVAVVLTGANHDGARGAARIREKGGTVIVQDPATAASPVMPQAALEATGTPHVYPPERIGLMLKRMFLTRPPP